MQLLSYHWGAGACLAIWLLAAGANAQTSDGLALPTLPPNENQPTAPALALPSVPATEALPSLPPAPATANPPVANSVAPAATTNATVPDLPSATDVPSQRVVSFGTFKTSLFFNETSIDEMKKVLTEVETQPATKQVLVEKVAPADKAPPPPAANDPKDYPVFTLSSILYRSPTNWTVWVGNKKITPQKNTTELKIVGLSANAATFTWTPEYAKLVALRRASDAFVPVDAVKNRLVKPQIIQFDDATATATFTLRPNQSFSAGYMAVFEGTIESPQMPPLLNTGASGENKSGPAATIGDNADQAEIERLAKEAEGLANASPTSDANLPIAPRNLFTNPFDAPKP